MVISIEQERIEFSARLNKVLDENGFPPKGRGRQIALSDLCALSQKGVRKWLEEEGLPERVNLRKITKKFNVRIEWLEYGEGPQSNNENNGSPTGPTADLDSKAVKHALWHYTSVQEDPENSVVLEDKNFAARVFSKAYDSYFDETTRGLPPKVLLRLVK